MVNSSANQDIPRPAGLELHPFRALRYAAGRVDLPKVLAPPYDVIDSDRRASLAASDPHNIVALTLPLDRDGLPGSRYAAAAATLKEWRAEGVLALDPLPALYVYEQSSGGHAQRGLLGAVGLSPATDEIILPHENTMAGPVADRLALTQATSANLEPIFLVYQGGGSASAAVAAADESTAIADVVAADGARHRLWAITDESELAAIAADLLDRKAVIADGHHRYATYLAYQKARHDAGDGGGPWDRGLTFLVDATSFGPQVFPIHRIVPGLAFTDAIAIAEAAFAVEHFRLDPATADVEARLAATLSALDSAAASGPAFVVTDGINAALLSTPDPAAVAAALPTDRSSAWKSLHVSVAHGYLFATVWGLEDREGVVDYAHDVAEAVAAAAASGGVAVLLAATPVESVAAVAAAGDRMPRKSTLFMPKPATGMAIRALADEA